MSGFEFTPGGIRALGNSEATGAPVTDMAPAVVRGAAPDIELDEFDEPVQRVAPKRPQARPVRSVVASPKDVVKLARQRLRDVKTELKRMRGLEKERAQLERLLAAADGKPIGVVRDIHSRRAG